MVKYFQGTVFNADAEAIVNTVNCTGVMGAGIAAEFMLRFPKMFEDYKERCENKEIQVGKVSYFKDESYTIINFPTKWHFKYPSQIEWIELGLKDFVKTYRRFDFGSVAFPKLGTLNGGLKWADVKALMEKYLSNLDIDVIICLDELRESQGIEAKMVSIFNENHASILEELPKITEKQKNTLQTSVPIRRFWHLSELGGIGFATYSSIFKVCFDHALDKIRLKVQSSFDLFENIS
jgi:O-acetyl-ADP-ribose deacetylase (regulator of RNase III)